MSIDMNEILKKVSQERSDVRQRTLKKLYKNESLSEQEISCCINAILVQDEREKESLKTFI